MKDWPGTLPNSYKDKSSGLPVDMVLETIHVCYVDDSKTSAYVTKKILKDQGFQVDHFLSAEPAIVALLENDYDLLITDLTLDSGGMDGDELVRFLRRSGHPVKKRMPILVLTGNANKEVLLQLYESGANGILQKPVAAETLKEKVEDLLPEKPSPSVNVPFGEPIGQAQNIPNVSAPQVVRNNGRQKTTLRMTKELTQTTQLDTGNQVANYVPKITKGRNTQSAKITSARKAGKRQVRPEREMNPFARKSQVGLGFDPVAYHDIENPDNGPADLTTAFTGAVRNAVGKLGEKSREKLNQLSQKPAVRPRTRQPEAKPPKQQANDAAALIARLRAEARSQVKETTADTSGIPILDMAPEQVEEKPDPKKRKSRSTVAKKNHIDRIALGSKPKAEADTSNSMPVVSKPEVKEEAKPPAETVGNTNQQHIDQLFEGLVPETTQAPEVETPASVEKSTQAVEEISGDKKMITAEDINLDIISYQDDFYQDNWGVWAQSFNLGGRGEAVRGLIQKLMEYKVLVAAVVIAAVVIFSDMGSWFNSSSIVQVETVRVGLGNIHQSIVVPGKVVSSMTVGVSPTSNGQVTALLVKEGAKVKKGQVLAELENERAVSSVKRAQGNLLSSQEETALAEKTWKRLRRAFQLGAVSRQSVEEAEARLKAAKAREAVSREDLRANRLSLNKLSVVAPFSGTVTTRHVQVGQWVSPSDAIMTVVDMGKREVEIKVDTADSASIKAGQTVALTSDAHPGKSWMEKVIRIAPAANHDSRANTVSVFVSLGAGAPNIRFGQQVDAEVRTSSSSNIIKLPIETLITRNGKTWVAVIENGKVHFSPVVIGLEDFTHVEVLEGVKPRQEVIVPQDANALHEGDTAQVMATRTVE